MNDIAGIYKYFSDKRFSTIAGTLVYFLLMSIAPFTLWLTLIVGSVNVERLLSHDLFSAVSPFLIYLKSSAESAAGGAGFVLLATSLYSSTNFFYHLRRSGEIIYDSARVKGGIRLRLAALALILGIYSVAALLASSWVAGELLFYRLLPSYIVDLITCTITTLAAFTVAFLLNIFVCPYKIKPFEAVPGSLLTLALWMVFIVGFDVYSKFASPEKLYGKIAVVIVFLLWCYIMMNCFVIGVIYNGAFKRKREYKSLF